MGIRPLFINIWLFFLLLVPSAHASETLTPLSEKLYYEAGWSGIKFGKIGIEIEQQANKADVTCDIASAGLFAKFINHASHTTLSATGSHFTYPDRIYESQYRTRKKKRHIKLTYKDGKIIDEMIIPPDNRDKRPAVPEEQKNSAYDLMSFLLQMRTEITSALMEGRDSFTINAFDGRRLTQADFKILGEKTVKIAGIEQKTIAISARRKFLAGYTQSEIEDFDPSEPTLTIFFSNDDKLIPLRMEAPFLTQKISADLIKKCGKNETCLLGVSE